MANELRKYQNFIGGLVEDNPLTSGATTLSSAGLGALSAVSASEYMAITIDPDGLYGAPEIVWITAHTASAVTATIVRGREGTSAREHARDVPWVHSVTAFDLDAPFFDTVLAAPAATFAIASIPTGYNDLRLVILGRSSDAAAGVGGTCVINGDGGNNYDRQVITGAGAAVTAAEALTQPAANLGSVVGAGGSANSPTSIIVDIPGYGGTTFYKTMHSTVSNKRGVTTGLYSIELRMNEWRSTAAITSIAIGLSAGNWVAGSRCRAYALR